VLQRPDDEREKAHADRDGQSGDGSPPNQSSQTSPYSFARTRRNESEEMNSPWKTG
jgi:hypothetical protein